MRSDISISVVIPVLNEAQAINGSIGHLRSQDPALEIIMVDGDPERSTVKAVTDRHVNTAVSLPGRATQMNHGASLARGDILLFLHADTILPPGGIASLREEMQDDRYIGGAFDLGIASKRPLFRVTERYVALRTRLTGIPFGDQAIFLRRSYFKRIGGYAPIPIMEDVELMRRIRRRGDRITVIPRKVMTSPRRWEREGVVYATLRNWTLQLLYLAGVPPERLARLYR
jgi:rSAM/selenodomain-associated transferase 2